MTGSGGSRGCLCHGLGVAPDANQCTTMSPFFRVGKPLGKYVGAHLVGVAIGHSEVAVSSALCQPVDRYAVHSFYVSEFGEFPCSYDSCSSLVVFAQY